VAIQLFFKEMTTPKLVPQKKNYTNEGLKLMNWRVEAFDGQWCGGPIPKFSTFNFHQRNWEVKISKFSFMGWVYLPWIPQKQAIFFCHLWVPNTPS
jgi:hypothetical protein